VLGDEIDKLRIKFDYLKKKQGRDTNSLLVSTKDIKLFSEFCAHPLLEQILTIILREEGGEEVDFDTFVKVFFTRSACYR